MIEINIIHQGMRYRILQKTADMLHLEKYQKVDSDTLLKAQRIDLHNRIAWCDEQLKQ